MSFLDVPTSVAYHLISALTGALPPYAAAAAVVLFTLAVRSMLLPLSIAAARGERARSRLLPQVRELQRKHAKDPLQVRREAAKLYRAEGISPAAGCLPSLAQLPFFFVTYRLFVSASVAGHQNLLLAHTLLGAQLGQNWVGVLAAGGLFSVSTLVFLGLFTLIAGVAWLSSRRIARTTPQGTPGRRLLRLMPYGTVVAAAFVPLAAGVYLLTTTAWSAAERALLHRDGVIPAT